MRVLAMMELREACEAQGMSDPDIRIRIRRELEACTVARKAERKAYRAAHESPKHRADRMARAERAIQRNVAQQARCDAIIAGTARPMVARNWMDEMPSA